MIHHRFRGVLVLVAGANVACALALFAAVYAARFHSPADVPAAPTNYWIYATVAASVLAASALVRHRSSLNFLASGRCSEVRWALEQTATVALALFGYLALTQDKAISRVFLVWYLLLLGAGLVCIALVLPRLAAALLFHGPHRCITLLYGGGTMLAELAAWIRSKSMFGLHLAGVVTPEEDAVPPGMHRLGDAADLDRILAESGASMLVVARPVEREEMASLKAACDRRGARLVFPCRLLSGLEEPFIFMEDGDLQFLSFRQEPLESPANRLVKRALDLAIALPVVAVVLPVAAAVVRLLQLAQSPGPLLHRQVRAGHNRMPFVMLKFRTMRSGGFDESVQAKPEDDRCYPAGRWLRRMSIDELPQFVNVLRGEMSVVGPRPHLAEHDLRFGEISGRYNVRKLIKPGITGLAQVRGFRGPTDTDLQVVNRIDSDLYYLENWSLAMDLRIILVTTLHVLRPPKAAV